MTLERKKELQLKAIDALKHGFYGTVYGESKDWDEVIFVEKATLQEDWSLKRAWGRADRDFVLYRLKDYGRTWALTFEEMK